MDCSFKIISYLSVSSVALNAEVHTIHILKNATSTIQIFFSLIHIFHVTITSKKRKKNVTILVS